MILLLWGEGEVLIEAAVGHRSLLLWFLSLERVEDAPVAHFLCGPRDAIATVAAYSLQVHQLGEPLHSSANEKLSQPPRPRRRIALTRGIASLVLRMPSRMVFARG